MPSTLKILICSRCGLESLPILPSNLERLDCSSNKLKQLPTIPKTLKSLNFSYNEVNVLPPSIINVLNNNSYTDSIRYDDNPISKKNKTVYTLIDSSGNTLYKQYTEFELCMK